MLGRFRHIVPAAAVFFGVATAWADAGYLPQWGPLELRFRVPVAHLAKMEIAPPPPTPVLLPPPPMPVEPPKAKEASKAAPKVATVVTNAPALEFDARTPLMDSSTVPAPDSVISPQMLLRFFTPAQRMPSTSTNSAGGAAPTPYGFIPPSIATPKGAPAPPASSATYSTPP